MNAQLTPRQGAEEVEETFWSDLRKGRAHVSCPDTHRAILREALALGAVPVSRGTVRAAFHGRCTDPRQIEYRCRPLRAGELALTFDRPDLFRSLPKLEQLVRCRKCPNCLRARASHWQHRAEVEIHRAARTWFVTLTFSPEEHLRCLYRAQRTAVDWNALSESERFSRLNAAAAPLLTKWLKRIRKESDATLRYLLVVEAHKSGLPHWHLLIHEQDPAQPVRKRTLQKQWAHGFSHVELVNDGLPARYVCKYLSKSALARVRASGRYGEIRPKAGNCTARS